MIENKREWLQVRVTSSLKRAIREAAGNGTISEYVEQAVEAKLAADKLRRRSTLRRRVVSQPNSVRKV